MSDEPLMKLKAAFAEWRKGKKSRRDTIPEALLTQARELSDAYGSARIVSELGVQRTRLLGDNERKPHTNRQANKSDRRALKQPTPSYSRLELQRPVEPALPLVEVETLGGTKLRVYAMTYDTITLLRAFSGVGGDR